MLAIPILKADHPPVKRDIAVATNLNDPETLISYLFYADVDDPIFDLGLDISWTEFVANALRTVTSNSHSLQNFVKKLNAEDCSNWSWPHKTDKRVWNIYKESWQKVLVYLYKNTPDNKSLIEGVEKIISYIDSQANEKM